MPSHDEFELYDLRVVVVATDCPMVCNHKAGDYFELSGENLSLPAGQTFPLYPLAAILPLLPAKQRPTQAADWMTTDAEIACPDPDCGGRFRVTRVARRVFRHGDVTLVPLPPPRPGAGGREGTGCDSRQEGARGAPASSGEAHPMTTGVASPVRVELAPGYFISRVVKGNWQLAGGHGVVDKRQAIDDMAAYVDAGMTTLDCADIYTGVETLIGEFLTQRRCRLDRYETGVEVHTKYAPDLNHLSLLSKDDVRRAIDWSRARLVADRARPGAVPLVGLRHRPLCDRRLVARGAAARGPHPSFRRHEFRDPRARDDARCWRAAGLAPGAVPVLDHRPENGMVALCRARGVRLLCYGTLAGGLLQERWVGARPPGAHKNRSQVKYALIIEEAGGWDWFQALLRVLHDIGSAHGVGLGTVASRYVLDRPQVAAVIVGARNTVHLDETRAITSLALDPAEVVRIEAVVAQGRGVRGDVYELERLKEGRHAKIMKYNLNAEHESH